MKNINYFLIFTLFATLLTSCVGDDIVEDRVDEELRITNAIDTIGMNSTYQFETLYLDNVGVRQEANIEWSSSDNTLVSINNNGLAEGLGNGSVTLTAEYQGLDTYLLQSIEVVVGESTTEVENEESIKEGVIITTSSYVLEGSFELQELDGNLIIQIADNYKASTALPGLFVYLSNNANSIGGAHEIAAVSTFNGAHTYTIPNVGIDDYKFLLYFCKPFNIKVGDGSY